MKIGGVSVQGSYHDINQDSFAFYSDDDVAVIVVSDGLGSKSLSQIGSSALCQSVIQLVNDTDLTNFSCAEICALTYNKWLESLQKDNRNIEECCATALFCFIYQNKVFLFQLGDGLAGVLTTNGVEILFDDKSTHYVNETDCLCSVFDSKLWKYHCMPLDEFFGAILCTDGVAISPDTKEGYQNFTEDFIRGYADMSSQEIMDDIQGWLSDWTGSDDKTIAFMLNEEMLL